MYESGIKYSDRIVTSKYALGTRRARLNSRKLKTVRFATQVHSSAKSKNPHLVAGPRVCRARHDLEIWHPCRPVTSSGARKSRFSRKIATLRPPQAAILATPPPVTWSAHAPESIDHGTTSAQPKPVHNQGALSCSKSHFSAGWAQSTDQGKFWKVRKIGPAVSAVCLGVAHHQELASYDVAS